MNFGQYEKLALEDFLLQHEGSIEGLRIDGLKLKPSIVSGRSSQASEFKNVSFETNEKLERATFDQAKFLKADWSQQSSKALVFNGGSFEHNLLLEANFDFCSFEKTQWLNCDFRNSRFVDCILRDNVFSQCDLSFCSFNHVQFLDASLVFQNSLLGQSRFVRCLITHVDFTELGQFDAVRFDRCHFVDCQFTRAQLAQIEKLNLLTKTRAADSETAPAPMEASEAKEEAAAKKPSASKAANSRFDSLEMLPTERKENAS